MGSLAGSWVERAGMGTAHPTPHRCGSTNSPFPPDGALGLTGLPGITRRIRLTPPQAQGSPPSQETLWHERPRTKPRARSCPAPRRAGLPSHPLVCFSFASALNLGDDLFCLLLRKAPFLERGFVTLAPTSPALLGLST